MNIIGTPSINPVVFYSGKIIGYAVWTLLLLSATEIISISHPGSIIRIISLVLASIGIVFVCAGMLVLGRSVRFGLPNEKTDLKSGGTYRLSRNPIYVGFNFMTIASVVSHYDFIPVFVCALYAILVYHLIILGEEKFMREKFGKKYVLYMSKTRRYL